MSSRLKIGELNLRCNDARKYITVEKIGEGQYGDVYKVRERSKPWGGFLAKKTFKQLFSCGDNATNVTLTAEINMLTALEHKNVIKITDLVKDDVGDEQTIPIYSIILEFVEHDLQGIIQAEIQLSHGVKKTIILQMFEGLKHLHDLDIMHRDLKPCNILLTNDGILKITDFGMAKRLEASSSNSTNVVTLNYRAPEIIFGDFKYDTKIDTWAAGCIAAQLWISIPLFLAETEVELLNEIGRLCGPMDRHVWPKINRLPFYWLYASEIKAVKPRQLRNYLLFTVEDRLAVDFMDQLLVVDPEQRLGARDALSHPFLDCPLEAAKSELAVILSSQGTYLLHAKHECQLTD